MAYDDRYPLKEYLNSINPSKRDLMEEDPGWEKNYPPYVINKCCLLYTSDAADE